MTSKNMMYFSASITPPSTRSPNFQPTSVTRLSAIDSIHCDVDTQELSWLSALLSLALALDETVTRMSLYCRK